MLMPSIFGEKLFDEWMDFPFSFDKELYGKNESRIMKTDVKENGDNYELAVDLPGFKKDDIKVSLENGYLTIAASKGLDKDEKDNKGRYIRKERYSGQCQRSFYVGDGFHKEDFTAHYEDGILRLSIPKKEPEKLEQDKYIAIEG